MHLEDTFTQFCVYNLNETHHYDYFNTFWNRTRHLQNINSRYLKHSTPVNNTYSISMSR